MARWITVRRSFDYRWDSGAITHFSDSGLGEHMVKDELADFAVENGYATEGKIDASVRSSKGGKRSPGRRRSREAAKAADPRAKPPVGDQSAADTDRSAGGTALDSGAE